MSAPLKLTDAQIAIARAAMEKRREALRQANLHPTQAVLARQFGVSCSYLQKVMSGRTKRVLA
jgi:hypothetical protein